ncbi:MAG: hypothetical protein IKO75_06485 [Bacteroidales bacterium]|nr:hypothetical protein [Bacteroidales bacterium]
MQRKDETGTLMHHICYNYTDTTKNRLSDISATDLNSGTYQYDALGNLVRDNAEGLTVGWNALGKVDTIRRNGNILSTFRYSPTGQRQVKATGSDTTFYIHDATGNVMCVYRLKNDTLTASERYIYGSKRFGMLGQQVWITAGGAARLQDRNTIGHRLYELTDHLGNVTTTLPDRKCLTPNANNEQIYVPNAVTFTDYYPFGFPMPRPGFTTGGYRYFFNGQEADNEVLGEGALHAFEYRTHDTRIGRFWSVDPLAGKFPWNSTYAFAENRVVDGRELEGLEVTYATTEFGSAVGLGQCGWNYVKGKGAAEDKVGITYFKYYSPFKISNQESVAGAMLASVKVHFGTDFSSDYFRQSSKRGPITSLDFYPMIKGVSVEGRDVFPYVGSSLGAGWFAALLTTDTKVTESYSITFNERIYLINLVTSKGFQYNDFDPDLKVGKDDHYLYYVDKGHLFNFFKKTEIKTNIKMILVDEETGSWESEQYQQGIEHKK